MLNFHLGFWRVISILLGFLLGFHAIAIAGLKVMQRTRLKINC